MFCTHCGTQMDEGAKFCTKCGAAVGAAAGAPAANTQEAAQPQAAQAAHQQPQMTQPVYQQQTAYQPQGGAMPYYAPQATRKVINVFALIAAALLAVAMFLPYASLEDYMSVSLIDGDGVFFLVVAGVAVVGALVKQNVIVIIAGVIACILTVIEVTAFADMPMGEYYTKGIGFYLMIIASVLLLISGFIKIKR